MLPELTLGECDGFSAQWGVPSVSSPCRRNPGQHEAIIDEKVWDQVQAQFAANLQAPRWRPRVTEASILTGKLYDGEGNRLVPSKPL